MRTHVPLPRTEHNQTGSCLRTIAITATALTVAVDVSDRSAYCTIRKQFFETSPTTSPSGESVYLVVAVVVVVCVFVNRELSYKELRQLNRHWIFVLSIPLYFHVSQNLCD